MTVFIANLPDRAVIEIKGEETLAFLQDLVTADVAGLKPGQAAHGALLTPQGKILFDFFIVAVAGGVLIDCAAENAAMLAQKLTMYRLRRALDIDLAAGLAVAAVWGEADVPALDNAHVFADPRNVELGSRVIAPPAVVQSISNQPAEAYQDHRYRLGIGDASEIGSGELFPHEACYDQFASVDFSKGCYVGQEVVSRMQHRGTARARLVPVEGSADLPAPGAKVTVDDRQVGTLLGSHGSNGLALIRLDRAAKAAKAGKVLSVDGQPISMHKPAWARWPDADDGAGDND